MKAQKSITIQTATLSALGGMNQLTQQPQLHVSDNAQEFFCEYGQGEQKCFVG